MPDSVEKYRRTLGIVVARGFIPSSEERNCRQVVYGVWAYSLVTPTGMG